MRVLNFSTRRPRDADPHSGVQPESKGPLFPAVLSVVESYVAGVCVARTHNVNLYGEVTPFATRDEAEVFAAARINERKAA